MTPEVEKFLADYTAWYNEHGAQPQDTTGGDSGGTTPPPPPPPPPSH